MTTNYLIGYEGIRGKHRSKQFVEENPANDSGSEHTLIFLVDDDSPVDLDELKKSIALYIYLERSWAVFVPIASMDTLAQELEMLCTNQIGARFQMTAITTLDQKQFWKSVMIESGPKIAEFMHDGALEEALDVSISTIELKLPGAFPGVHVSIHTSFCEGKNEILFHNTGTQSVIVHVFPSDNHEHQPFVLYPTFWSDSIEVFERDSFDQIGVVSITLPESNAHLEVHLVGDASSLAYLVTGELGVVLVRYDTT